jgi:arsenate reductase (glutaredoxin)
MTEHKYNILFLCTGNSARSIIAEAIMNRVGRQRFTAYSAGSHPRGEVNPHAIALLQKLDYDTSKLRSKSWDEFARPDAPRLDFVITVCDDAAGEACPAWPGQPMTAHWGMADPAAVQGSQVEIALAFADTYRMLNNRISAFANLKLSGLDRLSLQTKIREIGKLAITIYHNPDCGTSRNTLAMIRNSGVEPQIVEYLKTPPSRETLADLTRRMKIPVRALLREKGTPYRELGLSDPKLSDDQLLDAMVAHPVLINRPIVVTPLGVKLCRPSETVLDILPSPQQGAFTKEDGEKVVDEYGRWVGPR